MLNANNEINVKKEERKHSWSTVFAWLYLKTIGRILPKRWNRWAENILYYDKTTANNEVQTDAFKTVDEGVQVDLKPEVAEKDGEITSEDEGIYSEVSGGPTDEDCSDIENELIENNYCEVYGEDDEALKEHLEGISQELELERLQNASLKEENIELQSVIERLEKDYEEFTEDVGKREEELTEYKMELINKTRKLSAEVEEKDAKINSLTLLNEALEQDKKKIETKSSEQQQIAEIYMKLNELLSNVIEISEKTLQLNNQEQQEEKKSLENKVLELQKQAQALEGNKKWELAGIDGTLKEVFSNTMEMLEKGLYAAEGRNEPLKGQLTAQSVEIEELNKQLEKVNEEQKALTLSYDGQADQVADLQAENLSLGVKNRKLLSVIERSITEEAEVKKMDEKVRQNQHKLIDQIKKLEEALKEKDAQCKQLKESLCALESLEYRLESLESQSTTTKAQQQRDSSHQTNTKSMAKSEADLSQKNKGRLDKQLQKAKKEPVEQPNEKLTPNTFMSCTSSIARLKNNLTAEKKASFVKSMSSK